jgi:hypothetical protein
LSLIKNKDYFDFKRPALVNLIIIIHSYEFRSKKSNFHYTSVPVADLGEGNRGDRPYFQRFFSIFSAKKTQIAPTNKNPRSATVLRFKD